MTREDWLDGSVDEATGYQAWHPEFDLRIQIVEEEKQLQQAVLWPPQTYQATHSPHDTPAVNKCY